MYRRRLCDVNRTFAGNASISREITRVRPTELMEIQAGRQPAESRHASGGIDRNIYPHLQRF